MGWLIRLLSGAVGPYIVGAVAAFLLVSAGAAALQARQLKAAREDLAEARQTSANWRAAARGWEASYRRSEARRAEERGEAVEAATDAAATCTARVAAARRAAFAIRSLVNKEPRRDPQGCPVRELVPADQLRDALQPKTR